MKLRDWAPEVLKHPETRAYRLLDETVLKAFSRLEPTWKPLTADERELFISGVCKTCFDEMFQDDDEDEYDGPPEE